MDKIARLRQEIERRINILTNVYAEQVERKDEEMMNYYHGKVIALEELRPFLDTLSAEPDKSLEEAAETFAESIWKEMRYELVYDNLTECFKAGAEWQARQLLQGSPMPEDTVLFNKGVQEGRRLEREDMLKDAMESNVVITSKGILLSDLRIEDFNYEDKVRIVVLKEEE